MSNQDWMALKAEIDSEGIVGPFELTDRTVLDSLHQKIVSGSLERKNSFLLDPLTKEIFNDPTLQQSVKQLFEEDSLIWRSNFFVKPPNAPEIGWHHDKHFSDGDAPVDFTSLEHHFSILIALSDMDEGKGVLEYIPGSHLELDGVVNDTRPYHLRPADEHFLKLSSSVLETKKAMPLKKGQFALFHSALLHHSLPSTDEFTRVSMIARLVSREIDVPNQLCAGEDIMPFSEKRTNSLAVVTGGSRGIGLAIAMGLAKGGYDIAIISKDEERLNKARREIAEKTGCMVYAYATSIDNEEEMDAAFKDLSTKAGPLRVVFANAGIHPYTGPVGQSDMADWKSLMSTNVLGTYLTCKLAAKYMDGNGGNIITIGSAIGHNGRPNDAGYAASKAASWILTKSLAGELMDRHINVNELIPGPVITDMNPNASGPNWKQPDEVVPMALYLANLKGTAAPTGQSFSLAKQ